MLYSKIEGTGKPLLILHGFLGMSDNWKSIGNQLLADGFQVHLLDLRNHGRSFHSDDFGYEIMTQDVLEYCTKYQLDKITLLGHSMGGKLSMLFATTYPEKVEKLIVADISPKYYAPHHQTILNALNAVDFKKKPSRKDVETILTHYINDFGTCQFLMKSLYWKEQEQLAFRFNLNVFNQKNNEIGKALPKNSIFKNSTLFIRGGNSDYILDTDIPLIQNHFPNFELKTIPNAGHWLHAENPILFYENCSIFLKK